MKPALTHPQVALVGAEISRHDSWDEAVAHVLRVLGSDRDGTWFRYLRGGMALFDTRLPWPARGEPIARILNPEEYQAAKSRGDLADDAAADLYFRRAGAWNSDPASTQPTTMKETANDPKAKPQTTTYVFTDAIPGRRLIFRAVRRVPGDRIEATAADVKKADLQRHVKTGWLRLATEEERSAPPKPPGDPTDRREVSVALPNQAAAVQVRMVALSLIKPDPTQPRQDFSPESMRELVDSIKVQGVEQAILVRPMSRWRQIVELRGQGMWRTPGAGRTIRPPGKSSTRPISGTTGIKVTVPPN